MERHSNQVINKVKEILQKIKEELSFKENSDNNIKEIKYNDGKYIGNVINGLKEGRGIMYYNNGDRYEGYFKNNNREGKGTYYYNNGNYFLCSWISNRSFGKGVYYFKYGSRYEGYLKD